MRIFTAATTLLAVSLSTFAAGPVPRPAKELDLTDPAGKHVLLSQYKGKVVVIQFLLTGCPHCQAMSEMLTKLQQQYGPKGFQALGAAVDTAEAPKIKKYIDDHHVSFPVGSVAYETCRSYLGAGEAERLGFPQVVVIDRKGQIQAQTVEDNFDLQEQPFLSKLVEKLLGGTNTGSMTPKKSAPVTAATK